MDKRERGEKMAAKAGKGAEKCAKRRKDRKRAMWKACGRALWNSVEKEGGCGEKKQGELRSARRTGEKKRPEGRIPQKYPQCGKSYPRKRGCPQGGKGRKTDRPRCGTACFGKSAQIFVKRMWITPVSSPFWRCTKSMPSSVSVPSSGNWGRPLTVSFSPS